MNNSFIPNNYPMWSGINKITYGINHETSLWIFRNFYKENLLQLYLTTLPFSFKVQPYVNENELFYTFVLNFMEVSGGHTCEVI